MTKKKYDKDIKMEQTESKAHSGEQQECVLGIAAARKNIIPKIYTLLLIIVISSILILSVPVSFAANPSFVTVGNNNMFNVTEDEEFVFRIFGSDTDNNYPLTFSYALYELNAKSFASFNLTNINGSSNNAGALINFTPQNSDVIANGSTYRVYIILEDDAVELTTINVYFNVTNVNDAPNITSFYPTNFTLLGAENDTIGFAFNSTSSDPDLDYGDILNAGWWLDNVLSIEYDTYNYSTGFCDAGDHNITLIVNDLANTTDTRSWNVSIINNNRPPVFNTTPVIQNYTWAEDTNNTNRFNITNYVYDLDALECTNSNKDNITYSTTGNSNIRIVIENLTANVSFYVEDNWFGVETVTFKAYDGTTTVSSSQVTLNVTNNNDPPVIGTITNTSAWELAPYSYQISATDPDVTINPAYDTLTYSANITGVLASFYINPDTGLISFTPTATDQGTYMVNISVHDSYGAYTNSVLNLTIYNNQRPGILPLLNTTTNENSPYEMIVHGYDLDGDSVSITSDYVRFSTSTINSTAARFSFTPIQSDVGDHLITFNVSDSHGAKNYSALFNLSVIDQNTPPVLDLIINKSIREQKNLSFIISATDADQDDIQFRDNSTLYLIQNGSSSVAFAYVNLSANSSLIGNYSINVTVNDTSGAEDSQVYILEVRANSVPTIRAIATPQNTTTYVRYELNVSATDYDNDSLVFGTNLTLLNYLQINSTSASFYYNFDSSIVGRINITINVSDDLFGRSNTSFILNITHTNNAPQFISGISNLTVVEFYQYSFLVQARDLDNQTIIFNTNSSYINVSAINITAANFTFHTELEKVGTVNFFINITDGFEVRKENLAFIVRVNQNSSITYYSPSTNSLNTRENLSITFNQSSIDSDDTTLFYEWQLAKINETVKLWCSEYSSTNESICESNNRSIGCEWDDATTCSPTLGYLAYVTRATSMNWTYLPNMTEAGNYSVRFRVYDAYNGSASHTWNLSINDTNRAPSFGSKIIYKNSDMIPGSAICTNISTDDKILLNFSGDVFCRDGSYTSTAINFRTDTYFNYTTISWLAEKPDSANITLRTRTSATGAGSWSDWTDPIVTSGADNSAPEKQYIQYQINLSTTDTNYGVNVTLVNISYDIDDISITGPIFWFDLDDFFFDEDTDNTLTYNVSSTDYNQITIDNTEHTITVTPDTGETGSEVVTFTASDGHTTVSSNPVRITVTQVQRQTTPSPSSGSSGGSSSNTVTRSVTEVQNLSLPLAFELVVPGLVTIYDNRSVSVPITLQNNENITLSTISLSAASEATELSFEFDDDSFDVLGPGETVQTMLTITPYRIYGTYEVLITASVQNPEFEDTAKFFINSLERGESNRSQFNTKVDFARDLLSSNPECLELGEFVDDAAEAILNAEYDLASELLNKAIESCKYLISDKDSLLEYAQNRSTLDIIWGKLLSNRFMLIVVLGAAVMWIFIISYLHKKHKKKKQKNNEKKSEEDNSTDEGIN